MEKIKQLLRVTLSIITKSDLVIEVVDAREPNLTRSIFIEKYSKSRNKMLMIAINKSDLVPREVAEGWKIYFEEKENIKSVYLSSTQHLGTKILRDTIKELLKGKGGIVVLVGYPKTGKSSIVNALKGKHSAPTSSLPMSYGYTKVPQKFRIERDIYVWDTGGIIPPDGSQLERAIRGENIDLLEDPVKVAVMLIEHVEKYSKDAFRQAYGIDYTMPYELLEKIAIKRGWFYKTTKEPLIEEAAKAIIREYHEGKIKYYVPPFSP